MATPGHNAESQPMCQQGDTANGGSAETRSQSMEGSKPGLFTTIKNAVFAELMTGIQLGPDGKPISGSQTVQQAKAALSEAEQSKAKPKDSATLAKAEKSNVMDWDSLFSKKAPSEILSADELLAKVRREAAELSPIAKAFTDSKFDIYDGSAPDGKKNGAIDLVELLHTRDKLREDIRKGSLNARQDLVVMNKLFGLDHHATKEDPDDREVLRHVSDDLVRESALPGFSKEDIKLNDFYDQVAEGLTILKAHGERRLDRDKDHRLSKDEIENLVKTAGFEHGVSVIKALTFLETKHPNPKGWSIEEIDKYIPEIPKIVDRKRYEEAIKISGTVREIIDNRPIDLNYDSSRR